MYFEIEFTAVSPVCVSGSVRLYVTIHDHAPVIVTLRN